MFILIAMTLILTLAVTTWLFSIWSSYQETFIIKPIIYVRQEALSTEPVLELYITNEGAKAEKILRIEIKAGDGFYVNKTVIDIEAGFKGSVKVEEWEKEGNPSQIIKGMTYRVYIYTETHGLIFLDVVAE